MWFNCTSEYFFLECVSALIHFNTHHELCWRMAFQHVCEYVYAYGFSNCIEMLFKIKIYTHVYMWTFQFLCLCGCIQYRKTWSHKSHVVYSYGRGGTVFANLLQELAEIVSLPLPCSTPHMYVNTQIFDKVYHVIEP